jgi:vacuolar-type H+-ATPase subunit C/Vma6
MDEFELLVEAHRPALKAALAKLVRLFDAHNVRYVIGGAKADVARIRKQLECDQPDLVPKLESRLHTARQPVASYEESRARRS